eukprot:3549626-Prymnesium_polylepis.1
MSSVGEATARSESPEVSVEVGTSVPPPPPLLSPSTPALLSPFSPPSAAATSSSGPAARKRSTSLQQSDRAAFRYWRRGSAPHTPSSNVAIADTLLSPALSVKAASLFEQYAMAADGVEEVGALSTPNVAISTRVRFSESDRKRADETSAVELCSSGDGSVDAPSTPPAAVDEYDGDEVVVLRLTERASALFERTATEW